MEASNDGQNMRQNETLTVDVDIDYNFGTNIHPIKKVVPPLMM